MVQRRIFLHLGGASLAILMASSCVDANDDCKFVKTCETSGTGGAPSGGGGASGGGAGGYSTTGGSQGGAGGSSGGEGRGEGGEASAGGSGGEAGNGGVGGEAPVCEPTCDGLTPVCDAATKSCVGCLRAEDCSGDTPACDAQTRSCVECAAKSDCGGATPICDTGSHVCVGCLARADCDAQHPACDSATHSCVACTANSDCKGSTPLCDTASHTCVACLEQADCSDPSASQCDTATHTCKPCSTNLHCADIAGKNVCDGGTCFQCTGKDAAACGMDTVSGTPFVCDSKQHVCTTHKQRSSGLCGACVSDKECPLGQMCVLDTLGSGATAKQVGYFCHWKQGDTTNGAPVDCPTGGRPYVKLVAAAHSIDGETADVCKLAVSSCLAKSEFRTKNCAPAGTPDDALCGISSAVDSKCASFGAAFRCTMTCLSDDDCLTGSSCDTLVTPQVCTL